MKWKGFVDIGFIKCGQNSVVEYFYHKFNMKHPMERNEFIWNKRAEELYTGKYLRRNDRAVIITRDPVDRIWSSYNYFDFINKRMSYEEYLYHVGYHDAHGEENPVMGSNYEKWLVPFKKYNPLIINLEKISQIQGFPHQNKTIDKNENYKKIPEYLRRLTEDLLIKEKEKYNTPTWSIDVGVDHLR